MRDFCKKSRCGTLFESGNVIPGKLTEISQLFVKLVFCEQLSRTNKANTNNDNPKAKRRITRSNKHKDRSSRLSRSRNTVPHYFRRSEYHATKPIALSVRNASAFLRTTQRQ